ncbi:MAG: T9SS type A sorting domain-containing protein [Flavobacteriales bacterium]|nr:T9SS type A sorting domain-containing protein [Flavobacteriales bacterium]
MTTRCLLVSIWLLTTVSTIAQTPVLSWAEQLSNENGNIFILSSTTDALGNLYLTGAITGTVDLDPGPNTSPFTDSGFGDMFISKIDSAGNFAWAGRIGRDSYDQGSSIVTDGSGNVYVTGFFSMDSTDFDPGNGTAYLLNTSGGALTFILKLNADGQFIWAKEFGPSNNSPSSLTLDASSNLLITGVFGGTVDFDPSSNSSVITGGSDDIYITKLDTSGGFVWAERIDVTTTSTRSYSIATDADDNIYLTGLLLGTVDFDPGSGLEELTAPSIFGGQFILKLNPSGSFEWAKVINGSIQQTGGDRAIQVDDAGSCYTIGWFNNTVDFDPNAGVHELENTLTAGGATYLLKLDALGNFVWVDQFGDPGNGNYRDMELYTEGNIYVAGSIITSGDFNPNIGTDSLSVVDGNVFIVKYSGDGALQWALNFSNDSSSTTQGISMNVDPMGNVLSSGYFQGTGDFDPGQAIFNLTAGTIEDIFLQRLDHNTISGIQETKKMDKMLSVFPNPTNGHVRIAFETLNETGQVNVYNPLGSLLLVARKGRGKFLDLELPKSNGLYLLQWVSSNGTIRNMKVLKQ